VLTLMLLRMLEYGYANVGLLRIIALLLALRVLGFVFVFTLIGLFVLGLFMLIVGAVFKLMFGLFKRFVLIFEPFRSKGLLKRLDGFRTLLFVLAFLLISMPSLFRR